MRVISVNIEGSRHLDRVARFLDEHDPDVVCLQELFERDLPLLSDRFEHVSFVANFLNTRNEGGPAPMGLGFASKRPYDELMHRYAGPSSPRVYVKFDETLMQRWLLGGSFEDVTIVGTHMMVTADARDEAYQYEDTQTVIDLLSERERVVLCGDMNAHRGGPIFGMLADAFEDTVPQDADTTIDNELHKAAPLHLVVDGAFVRGIGARTELVFGVSDHAALVIETSQ